MSGNYKFGKFSFPISIEKRWTKRLFFSGAMELILPRLKDIAQFVFFLWLYLKRSLSTLYWYACPFLFFFLSFGLTFCLFVFPSVNLSFPPSVLHLVIHLKIFKGRKWKLIKRSKKYFFVNLSKNWHQTHQVKSCFTLLNRAWPWRMS